MAKPSKTKLQASQEKFRHSLRPCKLMTKPMACYWPWRCHVAGRMVPNGCTGSCVPGWARVRAAAQLLPRPAAKQPSARLFALRHKGSLAQGAQPSLLRLLQLLAPLHPTHSHHGCSRARSCWDLSQAILQLAIPISPAPGPFGQTLPPRCFTEAALYSSVLGLLALVTVGCFRLLAQVTGVPDMQLVSRTSAAEPWSDPGRDTTGLVISADILSRFQQCNPCLAI